MLTTFLRFEWQAARRSSFWQKNLALNLIIGFFLLLAMAYLLLLGLLVSKILSELYPGENPLTIFNGILLFYFLVDLFIRFLMQSLPVISLDSYLHLPIRKSTIVHYMVNRTILNVFNLIPLAIFTPVTFTLVAGYTEGIQPLIWFLAMLSMILANCFIATYLKRVFGTKPLVVLVLVIVIGTFFVLEKLHLFSFQMLSSELFGSISRNPNLLALPIAWMILMYMIHYHFLKVRLYPDEVRTKQLTEVSTGMQHRWLKSLGFTGTIIMLEMRLYWRHKRTRTIIYMLPLFVGYGMFFYFQPVYHEQEMMLLFIGVFMTGGMMLNYTNYAFGYESNYFDALLSKYIDFKRYIMVKWMIAIGISIICYVLTIPYFLFGFRIFLINTAMFFYNIGILSYVLLYFATYNKKRLDLSKSSAFNYQGIGAMNWLAILPAFLLPVLIQLPFKRFGMQDLGLLFVSMSGIIGLLFNTYLLRIIVNNFFKRKYLMASSFRELT